MLALAGWDLSAQALLIGVVSGLGYGLAAIGVVLIHRATGVVNLSQTEVGTFGAALFALLHVEYGVPYWLALPLAIASGALWGIAIDVIVMRRLLRTSRLAAFVGTVGVASLVFIAAFSLPRVAGNSSFPIALPPWVELSIGDLRLQSRHLALLLLVIPVVAGLAVVIERTRFGLAVRATSQNRDVARLTGVSPANIATAIWAIASAFGVLAAIAVSPLNGFTGNASQQTGPGLLLRILVVALAAGMTSLPRCLVAGAVVGAGEAVALRNLQAHPGATDLLLLVVLLLLVFRMRDARSGEQSDWADVSGRAGLPPALRLSRWWPRMPRLAAIGAMALLALPPLVWSKPSQLQTWTVVVIMAVVAVSLTMLTGWAGQLSLGQFALAGLGGLTGAVCLRGDTIEWGPVTFTPHLTFVGAVAVAAATGALAALVVGLPALRVRGLLLAVTTLAFATAADSYLFRLDVWSDGAGYVAPLPRPAIGGVSFAGPRAYYWLCLGLLVLCVLAVGRLRRTGAGRVMIAVRDNEQAAATASVRAARVKLGAFALSGAFAGVAGLLFVILLPGFTPETPFGVGESLRVVAVVVVGGLGSVVGAVLGALWVFGLPAIFGNRATIEALTAGAGLLIVQLYVPGGFGGIAQDVRDRLWRWAASRRSLVATARPTSPTVLQRPEQVRPATTAPALALHDVTVDFGGVRAVDQVSFTVDRGSFVGLIGSNGAGKTTLMNAICGFVPSIGRIELDGRAVERMTAPERHTVGLGRTFQSARLYPGLTVRETLLVALESHRHSHLVPDLVGSPGSRRVERHRLAETDELLDFLGLGRYASHSTADLSTGTRRIVELGTLLASGGHVLLLDEPTAGVAQREAEAFGPLIRRVQRELDATVLLIEHDVPMVMAVSDRVVCLEAGRLIADGPPEAVRRDPLVIASYLGVDARAVERSDTTPPRPSTDPRDPDVPDRRNG